VANGQNRPAVAFDGTNNLVVWADTRSGSDIYGARLTPSGASLDGTGFVISAAPGAQFTPAVTFDGTDFFVVWADGRAGSGSRIYGARVTTGGVVRDRQGVRLSSAFGTPEQEASVTRTEPAVAFDGSNHLVVWTAFGFFNSEAPEGSVFARHVSKEVVPFGTTDFRLTNTINQFDPDVAFDGTNFFVVYSDTRGASSSDLSSSQIFATRVSRFGAVVDPNGLPISTADGGERAPSIAWNGQHHLVAWADIRSPSAGRQIYGARVSRAGVVSERTGFVISAAAGDQTEPDVTTVGSDWFVAWQDRRSQTSDDIRAARVTGEGSVVHPDGIAIATSSTNEIEVASATGPEGTVALAYQRTAPEAPYGGAERVFLRTVSPK
jgi:large repetitive protein